MKIRNGFVSNSSSSSFVLITTKKTYKDVLSKLNPNEKKFLRTILGEKEEGKLNGKDILDFSNTYYTDALRDWYCDYFPEPETKYEEVNGCDHDFDRDKVKFCKECGKPRYVEEEVEHDKYIGNDEDMVMEEFNRILGKFKGYKDSYINVKDF